MYLTLDAISATLTTLAQCRPGTRVMLTYNQPPAALTGSTAQIAATFARLAADMGEPFRSRFLPTEITQLMRQHGFGQTQTSGPTRRGRPISRGALTPKSPELSG